MVVSDAMAELTVTADHVSIQIQRDEYVGPDGSKLLPDQILDGEIPEVGLLRLKRAKVEFTLEASGADSGTWRIQMHIALRGGQAHARPIEGGKETTDFSQPLQTLVSLLTHAESGGSADQLRRPREVRRRPRHVLIPIAHHKNSVLFECPSGEELLSLFHEVKDYCPVTVKW